MCLMFWRRHDLKRGIAMGNFSLRGGRLVTEIAGRSSRKLWQGGKLGVGDLRGPLQCFLIPLRTCRRRCKDLPLGLSTLSPGMRSWTAKTDKHFQTERWVFRADNVERRYQGTQEKTPTRIFGCAGPRKVRKTENTIV